MTITLTYFDIEGAGEPVRLALLLTKTSFVDQRIKFPEWSEMKSKTPQGVLPVMTFEEGGPMKTQSKAMLRYIGTTYNTSGRNLYPIDKLFDIEETIGLIEDITASWSAPLYISMRPTRFGYDEQFSKTPEGKDKIKQLRQNWITNELPKFLNFVQQKLDSNNGGKYLVAGSEPTIADCLAVPTLRNFTRGHIDFVDTNCLNEYPKIIEYIKNFCSLEEVKGRYTDGVHE